MGAANSSPKTGDTGATGTPPEIPRWQEVAEHLEAQTAHPTEAQQELAAQIGVELPDDIPAQVAAVLLRHRLQEALLEPPGRAKEIPESLEELEMELGVTSPAVLIVGTQAEISAWFAARYCLKAATALRHIQINPGDVVEVARGLSREAKVVSTIGWNGRLHMKGRPSIGAWPGSVQPVARKGEPAYEAALRAAQVGMVNTTDYSRASFRNFDAIRDFRIGGLKPTPEAVRALEELLESGETSEEAFQQLVTTHPQLIASVAVIGGYVHVIPKQRLSTDYVTDYLVLTVNSRGPRWVAVEIESPRHEILTKTGRLRDGTRHAVDQIKDWRDWLADNADVAHRLHGLYGIRSDIEGLVVIGRSEPTPTRDPARSREAEASRIEIVSWDYVLRNAKASLEHPLHATPFARGTGFADGGEGRRLGVYATLAGLPEPMTLEELLTDEGIAEGDL